MQRAGPVLERTKVRYWLPRAPLLRRNDSLSLAVSQGAGDGPLLVGVDDAADGLGVVRDDVADGDGGDGAVGTGFPESRLRVAPVGSDEDDDGPVIPAVEGTAGRLVPEEHAANANVTVARIAAAAPLRRPGVLTLLPQTALPLRSSP